MERLEVNKSFLEELSQNRASYLHGNNGYIIDKGDGYCYKIVKSALNFDYDSLDYYKKLGEKDYKLIQELDKIRDSIYPIEPPVAGIFYNNQYIGNIQKFYKGYESIKDGRKKGNIDLSMMFLYLAKILEIIKTLDKNNSVFTDLHFGNFVYKGRDVKVIDIDDHHNMHCRDYMINPEIMYDYFCRYMLQHYFKEYHPDLFLSMYRDFNYENSVKYFSYVSRKVLSQSK